MRDTVTFIVPPGTSKIPAGNHLGWFDSETDLTIDQSLPFPHVRATTRPTNYVLRIERRLHPQFFRPHDRQLYADIDVSDLARQGAIRYDQTVRPDA